MTSKLRLLERADSHSQAASVGSTSEFSFAGVSKEFLSPDGDPFVAVHSVSLDVEPGSFVTIIGPSGCGKSTLLNMAAGLMRPTTGLVTQRGTRITGVNPHVGYLTQQNNLMPWRTVEENVGIALEIRGVEKKERRRRIGEVLKRVGLHNVRDRYPAQLSGGMQKRVALARTLIYQPDSLLMDEPFGPLDAQLRLLLQSELLALWEQERKTIMFVTHDLEEAIVMADKVVVFGQAPGTIIHIEEINLPRPRDVVRLRSDREFAAIWERLWRLLEPQLGERVGHVDNH
jgi:NitT/TauT family transport system ATP-binding protein